LFTLILVAILILIPALAFANVAFFGDSLALGFGRASHAETHSKVGASSSCAIVKMITRRRYTDVYVSAGTNDPPGRCLEQIRARIHAKRSYWIVPVVAGARANVIALALLHGDRVVFYTASKSKRVYRTRRPTTIC
jgi:hypothetical protein